MPRTAPKPAQLSSCFSLPPALPARSISGTALSFVLNVLCYSQVSMLAQRSSDVRSVGWFRRSRSEPATLVVSRQKQENLV